MHERYHSVWICAFFFSLLATFTFYLATSDVREQRTTTGSQDNVTSFVISDSPESQISETEPKEKQAILSDIASDGLDLSWKLKTQSAYDDVAEQNPDTQRLWDGRDVQLPGDSFGSRISDLKPSAEYQTELFVIKSSQGSALHEAVGVTGTRVCSSYRFSHRFSLGNRPPVS